jgi:hypothetical protein
MFLEIVFLLRNLQSMCMIVESKRRGYLLFVQETHIQIVLGVFAQLYCPLLPHSLALNNTCAWSEDSGTS